jgi:hypothetical protein
MNNPKFVIYVLILYKRIFINDILFVKIDNFLVWLHNHAYVHKAIWVFSTEGK